MVSPEGQIARRQLPVLPAATLSIAIAGSGDIILVVMTITKIMGTTVCSAGNWLPALLLVVAVVLVVVFVVVFSLVLMMPLHQ